MNTKLNVLRVNDNNPLWIMILAFIFGAFLFYCIFTSVVSFPDFQNEDLKLPMSILIFILLLGGIVGALVSVKWGQYNTREISQDRYIKLKAIFSKYPELKELSGIVGSVSMAEYRAIQSLERKKDIENAKTQLYDKG